MCDAVNDRSKGGRKNSCGENWVGNSRSEENHQGKTQHASEDEKRGETSLFSAAPFGARKENLPGKHADQEFRQADNRIETEHIFPEEICFPGIDFVEAVGMEVDIARRKSQAHEPKHNQTNEESFLGKLFAAKNQREYEVEKSLDAKAPADRVPSERSLRNPGLQERESQDAGHREMLFAPGKEWQVEIANREEEERRSDNQRNQISGIDAGKTRPPKFWRTKPLGTVIGINEDKAGEDKEEIYADETDAGEILVPPGAAGKNSHDAHVKQNDMKRREETQRGQGMKAWPHGSGF